MAEASSAGPSPRAGHGPDGGPTADELQLLFHEVECRTYDERFGIVLDAASVPSIDAEVARLVGPARFARVLDVGCGTGYVGIGVAATGRAGEVHLVDLSPGMLGRARDNAARAGVDVRLVRSGAARLPYPDGAFDAVVCRGVLHHLHDPVAALAEWRRVVRAPGPVVLLSEPSPAADRAGGATARATLAALAGARRVADLAGRPLSRLDGRARDEQRYWDLVAMAANLHTFTPRRLLELGRAAGFAHGRVRGAGLVSIVWAAGYYVLTGELPALAGSARARRRAGRAWRVLRRVDHTVAERLLPHGARLTVQGVFWDAA